MEAIKTIASRTVVLPTRDIDTDQIIPARYLTATSREGFGKNLFHDLRFHEDGSLNVRQGRPQDAETYPPPRGVRGHARVSARSHACC